MPTPTTTLRDGETPTGDRIAYCSETEFVVMYSDNKSLRHPMYERFTGDLEGAKSAYRYLCRYYPLVALVMPACSSNPVLARYRRA